MPVKKNKNGGNGTRVEGSSASTPLLPVDAVGTRPAAAPVEERESGPATLTRVPALRQGAGPTPEPYQRFDDRHAAGGAEGVAVQSTGAEPGGAGTPPSRRESFAVQGEGEYAMPQGAQRSGASQLRQQLSGSGELKQQLSGSGELKQQLSGESSTAGIERARRVQQLCAGSGGSSVRKACAVICCLVTLALVLTLLAIILRRVGAAQGPGRCSNTGPTTLDAPTGLLPTAFNASGDQLEGMVQIAVACAQGMLTQACCLPGPLSVEFLATGATLEIINAGIENFPDVGVTHRNNRLVFERSDGTNLTPGEAMQALNRTLVSLRRADGQTETLNGAAIFSVGGGQVTDPQVQQLLDLVGFQPGNTTTAAPFLRGAGSRSAVVADEKAHVPHSV